MRNHENESIGVLQLINAQDPRTGEIVPFSPSHQRLAESLASQASVALTNRMLINQLEQLFESFIQLMNTAIDEKSPYTGGHCQRVPMLTMMLAEAVNETAEGPLKDFQMSEKDRYELKIAGLLHDCGKVTTPVHVVDKATKMETIFDRIHLIDTRFEVLKRDLEIEGLRGKLDERMAGEGYPRGLTREQRAVQARCMGIADIFEALTAKDRPYKKGKTLSESLEILGKMKLNHHVDPDLFDVFVRRKVYRRYAEQFLDKEHIDDVDEPRLPGHRP